MTSVDMIIRQLNGCSSFFTTQAAVLGHDRMLESQMKMAKSMVMQFKTMASLTPAAAARLNQAITESSFDSESRELLGNAVSEMMLDGVLQEAGKVHKKTTQTLNNVTAYMTESDWAVFNMPNATAEQKITKLVDRLVLLGVKNPSELTVKHCVALIASAHFVHPPDGGVLHGLVQQLKLNMQARRAIDESTLEFVGTYPAEPSQLSAGLYAHAYPDPADKPVLRVIDGYSAMLSRIPLRSTNKALSKKAAALPAEGMQDLFQNFLTSVGYSCPGLVVSQPRQGNPSASSRAARALGPALATPRVPTVLAIQDGQVAEGQPQHGTEPLALSPMPKDTTAWTDAADTPSPSQASLSPGQPSQAASPGNPSPGQPALAPKQVAEQSARPPATATEAADEIMKLEQIAAAGGVDLDGASSKKGNDLKEKTTIVRKRPAASEQQGLMTKKPAAAEKRLLLGCSKCRGSPLGCAQCKDPKFGGQRFTA